MPVRSPDGTSTFLLGRLAQEGRTPLRMLSVSPGRWRAATGAHAFAVCDGRLWLAQPRLMGDPAVASVPLSAVGEVTVRTRRPLLPRTGPDVVLIGIELGGRRLQYRCLDEAEACQAFADAVNSGRVQP